MDILFFLVTKHFIIDFLLQTPYQYLNKGIYGHLGGVLHAFLHGIATTIILNCFGVAHCLTLGFVDMFIHYHIDYFKVVINNNFNLTPNNKYYWWLLGLDQYLHYFTYFIIVYYVLVLWE